MNEDLHASGFFCMMCLDVLRIPKNLTDEEIKNAMSGFMVDHVILHGGDPEKVFFSLDPVHSNPVELVRLLK